MAAAPSFAPRWSLSEASGCSAHPLHPPHPQASCLLSCSVSSYKVADRCFGLREWCFQQSQPCLQGERTTLEPNLFWCVCSWQDRSQILCVSVKSCHCKRLQGPDPDGTPGRQCSSYFYYKAHTQSQQCRMACEEEQKILVVQPSLGMAWTGLMPAHRGFAAHLLRDCRAAPAVICIGPFSDTPIFKSPSWLGDALAFLARVFQRSHCVI